jgi:histidinol-phosphate/aromatic aminotransferase/cobyric acid decarboxylase-like protein
MEKMKGFLPTWSVNAIAQAAGLWCLENESFLADCRELIRRDHLLWVAGLQLRGLEPLPSNSIFTMLRLPNAQDLMSLLWRKHKILVRSCSSYGLPHWIRLAIRPQAEQERFFQAYDQEHTP